MLHVLLDMFTRGTRQPPLPSLVLKLLLMSAPPTQAVPHGENAASSGASTLLGEAEILGGPTGGNFDSPFHVFTVARPDNSTRLVGYNNNGDSFRVLDGSSLNDLVHGPASIGGVGLSVGLNRSNNPEALDHCGCWLQAVASLKADPPGLVRGFYHEEYQCNYSRNGYTNKSIAYAESVDGGLSFAKTGWPNNQIIQPTRANGTSTAARGDQIGEGDHSIVTVGSWMWIFFREWNVEGTPGVGLARSPVASGGVPGTWKKYLCSQNGTCGFTSDGIGGNSSTMPKEMTGATVTWRPVAGGAATSAPTATAAAAAAATAAAAGAGEFVSIGTRAWQDPVLMGRGPRLSFSRPPALDEPPLLWNVAPEPLIFVDEVSWSRSNKSRELYVREWNGYPTGI